MADVADLNMRAKMDASQAKGELKDLNEHAEKSGGFFKNAAASLLGFVGGSAIVNGVGAAFQFLKEQVQEDVAVAAQSQNIQAQLNQALKTTGGTSGQTAESLNSLAEKLSLTTTFSKDTTLQAEVLALRFQNIGGKVFPQVVTAAQDLSARMGIDLNSAIRLVGRATDDPIKGLTALSRLGVTFTADQKEQIKTLVESGQTAKAQGVILDALAQKFGGAAQAAGGTFAGQLQILKNSFEEARIKIGSAFIPVLQQLLTVVQPVVNALASVLPGALGLVANGITFASRTVGDLAKALQPLLQPLGQLFDVLGRVGSYLKSTFQDAIFAAQDKMRGLGVAIAPVGNIVGILKSGIELLTATMRGWFDQVGHGQGPFNALFNLAITLGQVIGGQLASAISLGTKLFNDLVKIVQTVLPFVLQLASALGGLAITVLGVATQVKTALVDAFTQILPPILRIVDSLLHTLMPVFLQIISIVQQLAPVIGKVLVSVIQGLTEIFQNVAKEIQSEVLPALQHIIPIILPIIQTIGQWVQQLATILIPLIHTVADILSTVLPYAIGVVTRVFQALFDIVGVIWPGIKTIIQTAINIIAGIIKLFSDLIHGQWGKLWDDVKGILAAAGEGLIKLMAGIVGGILGIFGRIIGGVLGILGNLLGGMLGFFGNLFGNIAGSIGNLIGNIAGAFGKLPGAIIQAISGLGGAIVSFFGSLPGKIGGAIAQLVQTIGNDIKNGLENIPGLGGLLSHIPGFAQGTSFAPGGLALVGEGGEPEIVSGPRYMGLPRGSTVTPLSRLTGGGGFDSQTIILQLDGRELTRTVVRGMPKEVYAITGMRGTN